MHIEALHARPQDERVDLSLLPASRGRRLLLLVVLAALTAATFAAYLRPNLVFDLANMVFCG